MENKIKLLRIDKRMKQSELAGYLKVAQSTLSGWETGKYEVDNENLKKMADLFGCSIDFLLGRTHTKNHAQNLGTTSTQDYSTQKVLVKFKERLKQLREEKELSKRELAVKLGIPPSTYNDYEAGKTQPDLPKIIAIAQYFMVNTDYLLGLSENRKRIVLKREEFEHLIPAEYKEQTRKLEWVELEDFCKEKDLTAENVRKIIEEVLKQVR